MINEKDKLINKFKEEMSKSEEDYTKLLKDQSIDIHDMVSKMRKQFIELRENYLKEIDKIEKAFNTEVRFLFSRQEKYVKNL